MEDHAMRGVFGILAAALCLLALPGCTVKLIEHAQKTEIRDTRVGEITDAWRGADGRLTVCAHGWPAERARDVEPEAFHLSVPLVRTASAERSIPHPGVDEDRVFRLVVDNRAIGEGCPERPADAVSVETALLPTDRFGRLPPAEMDAGEIAWLKVAGTRGGSGAMLFALPAEGEPPAVAILYRHDNAIFGGSRLAWIDPGEAEVQPNKAAYAALPLAIVADAAGIVFLAALGVAALLSNIEVHAR
jgi:hypothetical protein